MDIIKVKNYKDHTCICACLPYSLSEDADYGDVLRHVHIQVGSHAPDKNNSKNIYLYIKFIKFQYALLDLPKKKYIPLLSALTEYR